MGPLENGDPERIGRYRLIGRLGAGGMGQVFFGRSAGGRAVAVKRIHPHLATDTSFRERFAREVTAARQVSGAFTAPVIDAAPDDDVPWLVTSYVPSLPLDEAVRAHGGLPEPTLRVLATGLAEALSEIHRAGLIHRDLKPGNVLLAEDGPRVIDFGIARATDGTAATQSIIGTPGFMSPEQIQGEHMTPGSDMFAYGAVLVYAAAGVGPFGEGAMPTMVMRILQHEPDLSAVPSSLQRFVAACLTKDAQRRPGPGALLDALGDVPAGSSWLPPVFQRGVQEQVGKVNAALSGAPSTGGGHAPGTVSGASSIPDSAGAAAGGAAAGTRGEHGAAQSTAQPGDTGATSVMGAEGGPTGGHRSTAVYGQTAAQPPAYQPTETPHPPPYQPPYQPADPSRPPPYQAPADYGHNGGQGTPPTAAMPPAGGQDAYAGLYRGARQDDLQRRERDEARRQAEEQRQQEEQRRREYEREEQRRRQEAERAHQQRVRAEQDAERRARSQARQAGGPGLWSFVKLIPLLIIPIIQIPLGWGASYAWQWFTETTMWDEAWYYEGLLSVSGFFHALYLGYFLLNNVVAAEYLLRSARSGFATGVMLSLATISGTNGMLYYFGFFG